MRKKVEKILNWMNRTRDKQLEFINKIDRRISNMLSNYIIKTRSL